MQPNLYKHTLDGWLFGFYAISTFVGFFNAKSIFMKIVIFQTVQFSLSTHFNCSKKFLFQAIQFCQTVLIHLIQILFTHT